jgi:Mce-associated membrane protein
LAVDADTAGRLTTEEQENLDDDQQPVVDTEATASQRSWGVRWPITLALVIVVAVGGLSGWLGYGAYKARQVQQQRNLFLQAGRQAALNLTTISSKEADGDVQRILDTSIGKFRDDFAQRAPAFIDLVKKSQSNTTGSVTAAGLESEAPDKADVLVAVSVKTSSAGVPEQQPRAWRMRVTVAKVDDGAKVTEVVFVP